MAGHRLAPAEHLDWARRNYDAVLSVAPDRLDNPVPACPGWRIDTVADHLARSAIAFRAFITAPPDQPFGDVLGQILGSLPDHVSGPPAIELARHRSVELFEVARHLDPATPCPFVTGPSTVATWLWHIAGETCIHRSDVEHALGLDVSRSGAEAGFDLLQWSALFRVVVASRRAGGPPAAVRGVAIDGNEVAVIGDGPPVATVAGAGQDLALRLWNRPHGPLTGDGEAMSAWADIQTISPLS